MYPYDEETGALNVATGPGALSQINAMVTQGNEQARKDALASGLIGAGAGLLGYDKSMGPAAGLGAGLAGFNKAYDTQLIANKPKVTPLANGAFVLVQYPDGRQEIVKNDEVMKYMSDKSKSDAEIWKAKKDYELQGQAELAGKKDDIKTASEFRPMANSSKSLLDTYDKALEIVGKQGTSAQVQAAAPGLFGAFPSLGKAMGGSEVANNKLLQGLAVDEQLLNTAKTKGAISEKEMALFASPIPAMTDDRETVWKPWLNERRAVLQKLKEFYESEAARGESATARPSAGGSRGSMAPSSIPGLSSGAAKYFQ